MRLSGLFVAFFLTATSAQAAPMWFEFTGTLTDVRPSGLVSLGLTVGDPFTGYLLYDPVTPLPPLTPGASLPFLSEAHFEYEIQTGAFELGANRGGRVLATTPQRFEFNALRPYAPHPPEPMLWENQD